MLTFLFGGVSRVLESCIGLVDFEILDLMLIGVAVADIAPQGFRRWVRGNQPFRMGKGTRKTRDTCVLRYARESWVSVLHLFHEVFCWHRFSGLSSHFTIPKSHRNFLDNMSLPRLTFLYPQLFKPLAKAPVSIYRHAFCATTRRSQQQFSRHGTAVEPVPPPSSMASAPKLSRKDLDSKSKSGAEEKDAGKEAKEYGDVAAVQTDSSPSATSSPKAKEEMQDSDGRASKSPIGSSTQSKSKAKKESANKAQEKANPSKPEDSHLANTSPQLSNPATQSSSAVKPPPGEVKPEPLLDSSKPALETVLHLPSPSSPAAREHRPPHLQAPPYVHHFDTYTLVRSLEKGGFTGDQAVTAMKAVRSLLAVNLELAREGLVSKSDVENETYLFRAACSELRTEIQNNRKSAADRMRTQRAQLQHDCDIAGQRLGQDLAVLKDELKGMFDDRKMGVRSEQRILESRIQELNYKITVMLNSDMKSEVEGLRWVLTRRAAMAIVITAGMFLLHTLLF